MLLGPVVLFVALVPACRDSKDGDASRSAGADVIEEAPPPRITVPYDGNLRLVTLVTELDGVLTPQETSEPIEVPEGASVYLETWQRLEDHRVRLVDGAEKIVPFTLESGPVALRAESGPEPEAGGTWIRLTPTAPLIDGRIYSLRLEPELEERITDHEGRPYEDLVLELRRLDISEPEGSDDDSEVAGPRGP